jgi:hypothetical protein
MPDIAKRRRGVMSKIRIDNLDEETSITDLIQMFQSIEGTPKVVIHGGDGPAYAYLTLDNRKAADVVAFPDSWVLHGKRLKIYYANTPKRYRFWNRE